MTLGTPLLPVLVAAVLAGRDDAVTADLRFWPLDASSPLVLDLATTAPNSVAFLLAGSEPVAVPSLGPGLPSLAAPPQVVGTLVLDGSGHGRLELPLGAVDTTALAGQVLTAQTVHVDPLLKLVASGAQSVIVAPTPPPSALYAALPDALLPPGADALGAGTAVAADLDRDGWTDLVLVGSQIDVWRNQGLGTAIFFQELPGAVPSTTQPIGAVQLADFDGDGVIDLFVGAGFDPTGPSVDRLYPGLGDATFGPAQALLTAPGYAAGAATGDVDLDGDLDLVLARSGEPHFGAGSGVDRLLRFDGGALQEDPTFAAAPWNDPVASSTGVALGDIDLDGDLDCFVTKSDLGALQGGFGEPNLVLTNDGAGGFDDATATLLPAAPSDNSNAIAFGDVDLDGDLDALVGNSFINVPVQNSGDLYLNQGGAQGGVAGQFIEGVDAALEDDLTSVIRLGAAFRDLDLDGDLDAHFSVHDLNGGSLQPVYLNQGSAQGGTLGQFALVEGFDAGNVVTVRSAFGDFDLDGDLDLCVPASGTVAGDPAPSGVRVYENLTR